MNEGNEFITPELDFELSAFMRVVVVADLPPDVSEDAINSRFSATLKRLAEKVATDGFPRRVRKYSWLPAVVIR